MVGNCSGQCCLSGAVSRGVEDKAGRVLVEAHSVFPGQPLGYWLYLGVEGIESHLPPPRGYIGQSDELPVPLLFRLLLSQLLQGLLSFLSLLPTLRTDSGCKLPEVSRLEGFAAVVADCVNLFSRGLRQNL